MFQGFKKPVGGALENVMERVENAWKVKDT